MRKQPRIAPNEAPDFLRFTKMVQDFRGMRQNVSSLLRNPQPCQRVPLASQKPCPARHLTYLNPLGSLHRFVKSRSRFRMSGDGQFEAPTTKDRSITKVLISKHFLRVLRGWRFSLLLRQRQTE